MKRFFKLTILVCAAAVMYVPQAPAQNYNFNFGGLQYSSGPTVPGSCSRDGAQFFKNSTTKGWYTCIDGAYVANGGGGGSFLPLSLTGDTSVATNNHPLTFTGTGSLIQSGGGLLVNAPSGTPGTQTQAGEGTFNNAVSWLAIFGNPEVMLRSAAVSGGNTTFHDVLVFDDSDGSLVLPNVKAIGYDTPSEDGNHSFSIVVPIGNIITFNGQSAGGDQSINPNFNNPFSEFNISMDDGTNTEAGVIQFEPKTLGVSASIKFDGSGSTPLIQFGTYNARNQLGTPNAELEGGNILLTAAAPTAAASQIGFGSTTAAVTNCGSLAGSSKCLVINDAGTARYIPVY